MVIPLAPNQKLTEILQVGKYTRYTKKFVTTKTKEHVPHCYRGERGKQWGSLKKQRLNKVNGTLD